MREIWQRIETMLENVAPEIRKSFLPGASEADIRKAEVLLNVLLPEEVKRCYCIHDGSRDRPGGLFDTWGWLSLESMYQIWVQEKEEHTPYNPIVKQKKEQQGTSTSDFFVLQELLQIEDADDFSQSSLHAKPEFVLLDTRIQPMWWHPKWLPFMAHFDGGLYLIDLIPTKKGHMGQIIHQHGWKYDISIDKQQNPLTRVVASSITEFFLMLANNLERKRYTFDQISGVLWSQEGRDRMNKDEMAYLCYHRNKNT